jgi:dihydroxyacetone kinase DhaKLM complex PTS-EIIA-like component DhaM
MTGARVAVVAVSHSAALAAGVAELAANRIPALKAALRAG